MPADTQNKIIENQEQHDISSDSDSEVEDGHVHGEGCDHLSRNEKKARKAFAKLGMKPVTGIERVTIKRTKNMIFAITNPEVYKLGNDYIVFGEAKMEDPALQAQALAAQRMAANRQHQSAAPKVQEVEEDAGEDASGVEEKDIKIVMEQANVTRTKAIQTLKAHNNDIVNAIMELSL